MVGFATFIRMTNPIENLIAEISAEKDTLFNHPIYSDLRTIESLKLFMTHHVYAVWDFMNLLTYLQNHFTSISLPWKPSHNPKITRLINEIKLEEESDIIHDKVTSHFTYYIEAMNNLGLDTIPIQTLIQNPKNKTYKDLIKTPVIPNSVQDFLSHTYDSIKAGPVAIVSSFTFGRETIIAPMFSSILKETTLSPDLEAFRTYLDRHIELDGEEQGDMALELVSEICGSDSEKWEIASCYAKSSIQARVEFYNGIHTSLKNYL